MSDRSKNLSLLADQQRNALATNKQLMANYFEAQQREAAQADALAATLAKPVPVTRYKAASMPKASK